LLAPERLAAYLTIVLALLTLGLAAIGIYGVLNYSVQLRQFELGIRMAIGAPPYSIFLQILKDNLVPLVAGIGLGLMSLAGIWLWLQQTTYVVEAKVASLLLPVILIISLIGVVALLSVWSIIRKPASAALKGN
jgi:putative ABC transport system permease protein